MTQLQSHSDIAVGISFEHTTEASSMEVNEEVAMEFEGPYSIHLCPKNFALHYRNSLPLKF